ncbi:MAG: hypothetical protein ACTHMS_00325, partial [Jatrophihabitans sp.]|uniref:hypothetical protein n=1 Tax=Jatrophihabitans sp. TaxID=1932789 RepID=UPI003F806A8D
CVVSFREFHWRGLADLHTMAFYVVVTHAEPAAELHHFLGRPPPSAVTSEVAERGMVKQSSE